MEKIKYYKNPAERKQLIKNEFKNKFWVLHDNFLNKQGKKTDGNSGELIFTNVETPRKFTSMTKNVFINMLAVRDGVKII